MAKREKKVLVTGVSREDADLAFGRYAKADAEIQKLSAEIELQCAKVREKYSDRLSALVSEKESAFDMLQSFALDQKDILFVKKKSVDMTHGVIGFRTGTPKLKTLRGFTWSSALELVKEFLPSYIRETHEIAKDKLLADRDSMDADMKRCGLQVVQDETFYVEPKKEEVE